MPKSRLFGGRKRISSVKAKKATKSTKFVSRRRKAKSKRLMSPQRTSVKKSSKRLRRTRSLDPVTLREYLKKTTKPNAGKTSGLAQRNCPVESRDIGSEVPDNDLSSVMSTSTSELDLDENTLVVSPIKEPNVPDLTRASFRACGSYYNQWKEKVISKLPESSKSKCMVLVKLLERTDTNWPNSVDAFDELGVVFLSQAGAIMLDSRTRNMRLLSINKARKVKTSTIGKKQLEYLNEWLKNCQTQLKENKYNEAFEGLLSATIAFFDDSLLSENTESFVKEIESLNEMWRLLLLKNDEELEIDQVTRDGVKKLLSEVGKQLPASIRDNWDRTFHILTPSDILH